MSRPIVCVGLISALVAAGATRAASFAERCADPSVVRCYGFDDMNDMINGNPRNTVPREPASRIYDPSSGTTKCTLQGGTRCWELDTSTRSSGASALRFEIPSQTGADTSGAFHLNFADDYSIRFGEGEEFYVQYRYRLSPEMLRVFQGGGGFKSMIVGSGDWPGGETQNSCTDLETVIQTSNLYLGPEMYQNCGRYAGLSWWDNATCNQIRLQDVVNPSAPRYCCYGGAYPNGCWQWPANEWITVQIHVQVGTWNTAQSSRIEMWLARDGESEIQIFDTNLSGAGSNFHGEITNNDPANHKFGKLWFTPYNTNKDSSEVHPTAYVWYDDLIISRSRIPNPDAPSSEIPPSIPTNLRVQ